jgi:7,8-dihydroneopterin aldolase/epimerase/oxygenase
MGLIAIEGLQFYAHHGYYKEEQVLGGKYTVDIYLQVDTTEAAATDDLKKTINYEQVYQIAKTEMEHHAKLIEHVCARILQKVKTAFPQVQKVKVRLSKHNPPLKGSVERVYVELEE